MANQFLDYTGYGPTSAGRAPSAAELRRSNSNRYHTGRAIQAMQYQDPGTLQAARHIVGLGMGNERNPDAVRRTMFSTRAGQGALDAAFAGRASGTLGRGDPRAYSANMTQMMSGGFRESVTGGDLNAQRGRALGFNQRVSGNGITTERATIHAQKKMLDNLYGAGQSTDPSKLNGYNMEEASRIAGRVVGQGGMGQMSHRIKDASFGQRMAAAEDSEVDPEVLAGLKSLSQSQRDKITNAEGSGDSSELGRVLQEVTAQMNNPKAAAALMDIGKSKDATVFNDKAVKQVADTVKEVTKGMAALNDIYGDLSSDQAQGMLEQINGGRITNKQQARAAARTVDAMRNAAESAGMDPQQAMQMLGGMQEGMKGMLTEALGLDGRDSSAATKASAEMAKNMMPQAIDASKRNAEANKMMRDRGLDPGVDKTVEEYAADAAMMAQESATKFQEQSIASSDMVGLKEETKKKMREKAAEAMNLDTSTAEGLQAQQRIKAEQRALIEQDTGRTFEQYAASGAGKANLLQGESSKEKWRFTNKHAREGIVESGSLNNALEGSGLSDEEMRKLNRSVLNDLGGKAGLANLAEINDMKDPADRSAHLDAAFKDNNISDDNRKLYEKGLLGDKGRMNNYLQTIAAEDTTGGLGTEYADRATSADRLARLKNNSDRMRMTDSKGMIDANSIASAMFKGDVDNPMARADTASATLDAIKSAGASMVVDDEELYKDDDGKERTRTVKRDLTDMYTGSMSTKDGISDDMLAKIDKAAGGSVNLLDRVNKAMGTNMSKDEFLEKSKTDARVKDAAYTSLDDAGSEMGFKVSGSNDELNVMNEKAMELGSKFSERLEEAKGLQALAPMMSTGNLASMTSDVLGGRKAGIGGLQLQADHYAEGTFFNDRVKGQGGKKGAAMENWQKFESFKDVINNGGAKSIAGLDGSEDALAMLEQQITAMETGLKDGREVMVDASGNEQALNQPGIDSYKTAAEELRKAIEEMSGSQKVGTMTVTKLEVTGDFNSEKK